MMPTAIADVPRSDRFRIGGRDRWTWGHCRDHTEAGARQWTSGEPSVRVIGNILVALVALLHAGFLVLEMFLWNTPFGLRTFNMAPEVAASSAVLAANQGLYNGFLSAGLVWGLIARGNATAIKVFFLVCVIV